MTLDAYSSFPASSHSSDASLFHGNMRLKCAKSRSTAKIPSQTGRISTYDLWGGSQKVQLAGVSCLDDSGCQPGKRIYIMHCIKRAFKGGPTRICTIKGVCSKRYRVGLGSATPHLGGALSSAAMRCTRMSLYKV